ncbi:MAG: type II secretion system protein GspJ [Bradymonadaceae bacterium]
MTPPPTPFDLRGDVRPDDRGFTLLEVLISLGIMAALTAMMWGTINSMFRTRDYVKKRYQRYQTIRVALDRMASELASAYVAGPGHGAERKFDDRKPPGGAGRKKKRQRTKQFRDPVQFGMNGDGEEVSFTSLAHLRTVQGEQSSHHAEIGYSIERIDRPVGRGSVDALVRREDTTLDDDITEGGKTYVLIPNIRSVEFEYWDPGEPQIGSEEGVGRGDWISSWDTSQKRFHDRLPTRIRITVTMPPQGPRGSEETFSTQTEIHMHEQLEF